MKVIKSLKILTASLAVVALGVGSAFAYVDIGGENDTTGPHSDNNNSWDIHQNTDISVHNSADVDNDFSVEATSGDNLFGHNTEIGDIWTGDVLGDISFENVLNNADISFMGLADLDDINVDLANMITGPYSENRNDVDIDRDVDVNISNHADIDNEIALQAETGHNSVHCNTVVGDVTTGDVHLSASVENVANAGMDYDLSDLIPTTSVSADFSNGTTGPDSRNINDLDLRARTDIDVSNRTDIDNNFSAEVNTGHNEISGNTVVDNIRTGDISIDFHSISRAN